VRASVSRSLDLFTVATAACAAAVAAIAPGVPTALRAPLGVALVLVLPGYAVMAAAWPSPGRSRSDRVVLTLGSSIALAILGGLLLNFTSWGLERKSWAALLAAVTLVAAGVAVAQRERAGPPARLLSSRWSAGPLLVLALAALIAVAAVGISRQGALRAQSGERFTQLWMLPSPGKQALQIGLANREGAAERYRLVVRAAGRPLATFGEVDVAAGDRWEQRVQLPAALPPHTRVQADLYRADRPGMVYRHVTFWSP